jgi:hypothetical protein
MRDVRDAQDFRGNAAAEVGRIAHGQVRHRCLTNPEQIGSHSRTEQRCGSAPHEYGALTGRELIAFLNKVRVLRR